MSENKTISVFARSSTGSFYIGILGYVGDRGIFWQLPDDIEEEDLLNLLRRAQKKSKIRNEYRQHRPYNHNNGPMNFLIKCNSEGIFFFDSVFLHKVQNNWIRRMSDVSN